METIFRKVSTEERLPNKGGLYWVIDPNGVAGSVKVSAIFQLHTDYWYVVDSGSGDTIHPTYWLEEVELPSDEDIDKKIREVEVRKEVTLKQIDYFLEGTKWMRDFVLAGKAVTAKDNVR